MLRAYTDLVDARIIEHAWFGGDSWSIVPRRTDSPQDQLLAADFTSQLRARRPDIAREVQTILDEAPATTQSGAIRAARRKIGDEVINHVLASQAVTDPLIERRLRRRVEDHLTSYLRSDRFADKAFKTAPISKRSYAGYIADAVNDLTHNPSLSPIIASRDTSDFLQAALDEALAHIAAPSGVAVYDSSVGSDAVATRIGLLMLKKLVPIGFQDIEEVLAMRATLATELGEFNSKMHEVAQIIMMEHPSRDWDRAISSVVRHQLLPRVEDLSHAVEVSKPDYKKWLIPTLTPTSGLAVAAAVGLPFTTLLQCGVAAAASVTAAGADIILARRKQRQILAHRHYRGLSLVFKLEKNLVASPRGAASRGPH